MSSVAPMNVITTPDGKEWQKPTKGQVAAGVVAGSVVNGAVKTAMSLPSIPAINKMGKVAKSADIPKVQQAIIKALDLAGLSEKGVKVIDYSNGLNAYNIEKSVNNFKPKNLLQWWGKLQAKMAVNMTKNGQNAFFVAKNPMLGHNKIHINTKKLGTAAFHEIGHAMNFNNSKFWKGMQYARGPLMLVPALLTSVALFKRKKAEGEEPKGFFDKTTTFIKNNVGKLSFAAMLPVVAEELKATSNGNKLAKQLLSPENYKKVLKTNAFGASTYVLAAVATGVGAWAANKIRDKIASPKEIQQPPRPETEEV